MPQELVELPIDDILPHPGNPRVHDDAAISASLDTIGFAGAVLVQRSTMRLVAGHGRLKAARAAGAETLPAFLLDLDDDQALKLLLADNRTGDLASYDDAALVALLEQSIEACGDLAGTGYTPEDLEALIVSLTPAPHEAPALDGTEGVHEITGRRTLTFNIHVEQAELIEAAIRLVIEAGLGDDERNPNARGNALYQLALAYTGADGG